MNELEDVDEEKLSHRDYGIIAATVVSFATGVPSLYATFPYVQTGNVDTVPLWVIPMMAVCCTALLYINFAVRGFIHSQPMHKEVFVDE